MVIKKSKFKFVRKSTKIAPAKQKRTASGGSQKIRRPITKKTTASGGAYGH